MEKKKDWVEEIGNIELEISCTSGVYDLAFLMGYGWYEEVEKIVEQIKQESRGEGRKHMQGWECPKCGSVYSPLTFECTSCKNSGIKVRTSDKTSGYDNTSYLN